MAGEVLWDEEPAAGPRGAGSRDRSRAPRVAQPAAHHGLAALQAAARHDAQHLDTIMRRLAGTPRLSRFAEHVLAHPRSFALKISNIPGPRRPVRVLGVPVRALYSLAEIGGHHALRVAVVSLAGTRNVGLVADPTLLTDVGQLAAGMQAEAAALIDCLPPA